MLQPQMLSCGWFWSSVFQRRAPASLAALNEAIAPQTVGQGNTTRNVTEAVLGAVHLAYEEASGKLGTAEPSVPVS